ncbi:MAG: hypothetical protein SVM80_08730 [Halobacteriota archaeon]|nr:hypothetical protein [Halobacteriota archaeon]
MPDHEEIILKTPVVPDGETLKFCIKKRDTDEIIGYRTNLINRISENGKEYYKIQLKTEYIEGDLLEETTILEMADILKPIFRHAIAKRKDGRLLSEAKMDFEGLEMPPNCCASSSSMGLYLRAASFIPKSMVSLNVMMMDQSFKINATTAKEREIITVPAGTFECHKVELTPDIGSIMDQLPTGFHLPSGFYTIAQRLASRFMPSIFNWYAVEAPHHSVKYEGVEYSSSSSSMGEPIIEELISID